MPDDDIYRELAERHGWDLTTAGDPDGAPAMTLLGPIRYAGHTDYALPDAQSVAYRTLTEADAIDDQDLLALADRAHPGYVPGADVAPATVEEYEAARWDAGRTDPRPGT